MENNNQAIHTQNSKSDLLLIVSAEKEAKISDSKNREIIESIEYVMTILGIVKDKKPAASEMEVIVHYLKKHSGNFTAGEVKLSFEFALQKRFPANLELYGGVLSVKFITDVLMEYSKYKRVIKFKAIPKDPGLNNIQRLGAIRELLDKETLEKLDQIGKPKIEQKQWEKPAFWDIHQRWFRQFDALHIKYPHEYDHEGKLISGRWIKRYGQIMNVEAYFNKKVEQLQLSKERNKEKL